MSFVLCSGLRHVPSLLLVTSVAQCIPTLGLPVLLISLFGNRIQRAHPDTVSIGHFAGKRFGPVMRGMVVLVALFNMSIAMLAEYTAMGSLFKVSRDGQAPPRKCFVLLELTSCPQVCPAGHCGYGIHKTTRHGRVNVGFCRQSRLPHYCRNWRADYGIHLVSVRLLACTARHADQSRIASAFSVKPYLLPSDAAQLLSDQGNDACLRCWTVCVSASVCVCV
jgi:hypothetical protein